MYPNPAVNFVNLSFSTAATYDISIYDLLGKEVARHQLVNTNTKRIVFGHLPSAVYVVLVKNEDTKQFATYKLIKE